MYPGNVQYRGGYLKYCGVFSTMGVHEYYGVSGVSWGYLENREDTQYRGGYHDARGGYHEYGRGYHPL